MNSWYARYPGDYRRKTAHLSLAEHGAYGLCLDHYYATGQPLPLENESVYRICGAVNATERAAVDSVLRQFFERREDGYHNSRTDAELAKRDEKRRQQADAGRIGGQTTQATRSERLSERLSGQPSESEADVQARPQPHPQPHPNPHPEETPASPSATSVCHELAAFWNDNRGPLPELLKLSKSRLAKLTARLNADASFPDNFRRAVLKARATPFCCGSGERGWKANFDWLIANDTNCLAVLEGKYDGKKGAIADERTSSNFAVAGINLPN